MPRLIVKIIDGVIEEIISDVPMEVVYLDDSVYAYDDGELSDGNEIVVVEDDDLKHNIEYFCDRYAVTTDPVRTENIFRQIEKKE